jgi:hypothetical protein
VHPLHDASNSKSARQRFIGGPFELVEADGIPWGRFSVNRKNCPIVAKRREIPPSNLRNPDAQVQRPQNIRKTPFLGQGAHVWGRQQTFPANEH